MNDRQAAQELVAAARELSAAPRPWDRNVVNQWSRKIDGMMKELKGSLRDVQMLYSGGIVGVGFKDREKSINETMAARHEALRLQSLAGDTAQALLGLQSYLEASMPEG